MKYLSLFLKSQKKENSWIIFASLVQVFGTLLVPYLVAQINIYRHSRKKCFNNCINRHANVRSNDLPPALATLMVRVPRSLKTNLAYYLVLQLVII